MKRLISIICVMAIFCTSVMVLASDTTETTVMSDNLILNYEDIDTLMRENSVAIKSLTATSEASAYAGVNALTGEWNTGYNHENTKEKKQRLEDLEKEIQATVTSVKNTFITAVNLEKSLQSLEIDIASMERAMEIQDLLYSQEKISKVEYQAFQNTYTVTKSNIDTINLNLSILKKSINVNLGRDIDATISLNQNITFDDSILETRDYSTDYAATLSNSKTLSDMDDYLDYHQDVYDVDDNIAAKLNLEAARLLVEQVNSSFELAFVSVYNGLDSANTEIVNSKLLLENAENALTIAKAQYKSGMISLIDYETAQSEVEKAEIALEIAQNSFVEAVNSYNSLVNGEISDDDE